MSYEPTIWKKGDKVTSTKLNKIENGIQGNDEEITSIKENLTDKAPVITETASGSIASFTDGADDLPLKSLVIDINPVQDLHGQDAPYPAGGGKNLFNGAFLQGYWAYADGGWVYSNGWIATEKIPCKPSTYYTVSADEKITRWQGFVWYDSTGAYLGTSNEQSNVNVGLTKQSPSDAAFMVFNIAGYPGSTSTISISDVTHLQIEEGQQASDYTPYSNICPISGWTGANVYHSGADTSDATTYSITFPSEAGTVYGGTLDVTTGKLTVDRAMVDLGAKNWYPSTAVGRTRFRTSITDIERISSSNVRASLLCSNYPTKTANQTYQGTTGVSLQQNSADIYIYDPQMESMTTAEFKSAMSGVQLCYELATPQTYQLTPTEVATLLGDNTIWADTGDTEVEYRTDPDLYIQRKMPEVPVDDVQINGTSIVSDGVANVPVDTSLTIAGAAADAKKTGDEIGDLKSATSFNLQHNIDAYINRGMNLYNSETAVEGYINIKTGAIISGSDYRTSDYIRIENGKSYTKRISGGGLGKSAGAICLYDSNGKFIKNVNVSAISGETDWFLYTANDIGELNGATYIRFSTTYSSDIKCFFGEGTEPLATIPEYEFSLGPDGTIDYSQVKNPPDIVEVSNNLLDPESIVNGHLTTGGKIISHELFITSDFMPVTPGTTYLFHINPQGMGSATGLVWLYNSDKTYIQNVRSVPVTGNENWYSISVVKETAVYARVSSYKNIVNNTPFCFFEGNTIPDNIPEYGTKYLNPEISVNYSQIVNVPAEGNYDYKSALTGKVWYALGDSATHGDGAITLTEGIYAGQLGVYPFYIGNRTGMIVHNLAVNGAVMATISDKPDRYQWSVDGHYDSVGSDADYITMWIGANDMWQSVPIGTIDSSDPTTFYGAYNKVLTYYVNNFPKAKIGIVASFWCTAEYAEAVIAIGAKYGVPVLNLYNDPSRPVTVGSKRPDVATTVKTTRNNQWIVGNGNTHPSSEYHEIESYFIEEWLKTL